MLPPSKLGKAGGGRERHMAAKGCRSKNVSMFFSNSIANRKGFLPCLSPFRSWTGGSIEDAGAWHSDETRNITGQFNTTDCAVGGASGAFATSGTGTRAPQTETVSNTVVTFDASRVVPTGPENVPVHVLQPVIIYLGNQV